MSLVGLEVCERIASAFDPDTTDVKRDARGRTEELQPHELPHLGRF